MKNFFFTLALLVTLAGGSFAQEHPADRIQRSTGVAIVNADGSITVTTYAPGGIPREVRVTPRPVLPPTPCTELAFAVKSGTAAGLYQCFGGAWVQISRASGLTSGTVTSITAGTGLTATPANPITGAGTIGLATANSAPGSYTCVNLTVDATGRVTAASNGLCGSVTSITAGGGIVATPNPITGSGSLALDATANSAPGSYTCVNLTVDATGRVTAASNGSCGGVSSVGLTMPAEFTVSGSPVTGAGTLAVSKASQASNLVFASPAGGAGVPSFRALTAADLPANLASNVTLAGDVTGAAGSNTLSKVQGFNLSLNSNTTDGTVIAYNADNAQFENSFYFNRGGLTYAAPGLTLTNALSTNGTVVKSGGVNGTFDAGGYVNTAFTTVGSISGVVNADTALWCVGLDSAGTPSVDCATLDYAMRHNADGTYSTVENGVASFTSTNATVPGDILEVEKFQGQIRYKLNRLIFRVVALPAATSLKAVVSIATSSATVNDTQYYGGAQGTGFFSIPQPPDVDWIRPSRYYAFKCRNTIPPTPPAGQVFMYLDCTTNRLTYIDLNGTTYTVPRELQATGFLDFPNTAAQATSTGAITVNGATAGDACAVGVPAPAQVSGGVYTCWVTSGNNVNIVFANITTAAINPTGGNFTVKIYR